MRRGESWVESLVGEVSLVIRKVFIFLEIEMRGEGVKLDKFSILKWGREN